MPRTLAIGSIPQRSVPLRRSWCSSMNRITSSIGGRAPPRRNGRPPSKCRWLAVAQRSHASGVSAQQAHPSWLPAGDRCRVQLAGPTAAQSQASVPASRRPSRSLPTATLTRDRDPEPAAPHAHAARRSTSHGWALLHPLKEKSHHESRAASLASSQRAPSSALGSVCGQQPTRPSRPSTRRSTNLSRSGPGCASCRSSGLMRRVARRYRLPLCRLRSDRAPCGGTQPGVPLAR